MEGYPVASLEGDLKALKLQPRQQHNFKVVTSEISKKACPGFADSNARYEELMVLVDETLRGRSEFCQLSSEAEADEKLTHTPSASIHVMNATRVASDEELLMGGAHTDAFICALKARTASIEGADDEIILDGLTGIKAQCSPQNPIDAMRQYNSSDTGAKCFFACPAISAGWSADTEAAARTGVASLIDCARDVFAGRYANGFVLARPPSHHAVGNAELARNGSQTNMPFGFCHLNSIASAIANLRASHPELRVCIFDIDVHAGNGNEDTFWDDPRTFTISIHELDIWPGDKTCRAEYVGGPNAIGSVLNFPIPTGSGDSEYYHIVKNYIFPQIKEFAPDIVFVAAGYDALHGDAYADQELTPDWYGWCIAELMTLNSPLVLNLEGGYTPENVVRAIGRTIDALAGADAEDFYSFMSIYPQSETAVTYNNSVCEERRTSLTLKRTSFGDSSDATASPQVKADAQIEAAMQFKAAADAKKAAIEDEASYLTGKVNIKARTKKLKEASQIVKSQEYIDACLVICEKTPKFGNFAPGQCAPKFS